MSLIFGYIRWLPIRLIHFAQANENLCDQASPAGLMAGPTTAAGVAVEVFMEGNQITPVGIIVEQLAVAKDRPFALVITQENARQSTPHLYGNFIQIPHLTRARRAFNEERIAVVLVVLP